MKLEQTWIGIAKYQTIKHENYTIAKVAGVIIKKMKIENVKTIVFRGLKRDKLVMIFKKNLTK